jgi:hypothetical protein
MYAPTLQMSRLQSQISGLQVQLSAQLQQCTAAGIATPDCQQLWDVLLKAPDGASLQLVKCALPAYTQAEGKENRSGQQHSEAEASIMQLSQKLARLTAALDEPPRAGKLKVIALYTA